MLQIGFLASHEGTTMQAIIDACRAGQLKARPVVLIHNNSTAACVARARASGIPTQHLSAKTHPNEAELDTAILETLSEHGTDVVVLAGYMKKLGPQTLDAYAGRILNSHPSLLPRFGGPGMYGDRVHGAVLAAQVPVSGATIHTVEANYDQGPILKQATVPVLPTDTVASLGARVREAEQGLYVEALAAIAAEHFTP